MADNSFWLDYDECRSALLTRLSEPPPTRIQLLTGPRQVGKTTLLLEVAKQFGEVAHYVAADDPNAGLPGFWERIWSDAETRASKGYAVILIDEIQHIAAWAAHIKGQYDRIKRKNFLFTSSLPVRRRSCSVRGRARVLPAGLSV
jgi:hypothetical protein